jgi:phosphoenolpyruvate-protein phosphotransferase
VIVRRAPVDAESQSSGDQVARLQAAVAAAQAELADLATAARQRGAADTAAILDAQVLFLDDPALVGVARDRLAAEAVSAEAALAATHGDLAAAFAAIDDATLRARAGDLTDVVDRVLRHLGGVANQSLPVTPFVLVAADLSPSTVAGLDPAVCLALALEGGGPTGHSAIIARGLGIPAVVAVGGLLAAVDEGDRLLVDGARGLVVVEPPEAEASRALPRPATVTTGRETPATGPAVTRDGLAVTMLANIDGIATAERAVAAGAEGIGLFRTEGLLLDRPTMPGEDEQRATFRAVARAVGGRPVVIRTLDIGGDKAVPALRLPVEANPFLGLRGLRLSLQRPDLFQPHLRAILRATADGPLAIMFPMVTSAAEVVAARALLGEAWVALVAEGHPLGAPPPVGVMIETPAAALTVDLLAPHVDFVSVGTNDLVQYTLAADRASAAVAALADPYHPAHLRLLGGIATAARAAGIDCSTCGELAADPLATALLIGLGYTTLSMAPAAIPATRARVRGLDGAAARTLAEAALRLPDAAAVRALLAGGAEG